MSNYLGPQEVIGMKKDYLCPPSWNHFYQNPPQIVKGKMQYLYDEQGKRYLDCFAGVSVMNCGHCNDAILAPIIEQMQTLQHTTIIYLTEQMGLLAKKLSEVLPGDLRRSFFCCTGSEANETALLMPRLTVLGCHGCAPISISSNVAWAHGSRTPEWHTWLN